MQANPASLPPSILAITGVIPFTETIFLWQSGVMLLALILVSLVIAYMTAPSAASARDAKDCGVDVSFTAPARLAPTRPGEWLEHSPLLIILLVLLAGGWLVHEFSTKPAILAISGLNTYNLLFLMLGALLHWRPRSFLDAVARAVPTTTGVLIQFPLYGSIAAIMTTVNGSDGETLAHHISTFFVQIASHDTYALLMGVYSAVLGFFILRRRQVDHRGAVRDAGGQRAAIPPRLGGADLQRRRGAAEPDQPVLHAAVARRAGAEGARPDRLLVRPVAGAHPAGAGAALGPGQHPGVHPTGDAVAHRRTDLAPITSSP